MLSDYFDEYSLNARVRPALLAILPPTLAIYVTFPQLYEFTVGLVGLLLLFGLLTAMAHFVRYRGKVAENKLYESWGGKPTTYLLRQCNNLIDKVTKQRYYDFFENNINGWSLPDRKLEDSNLPEADAFYESAVKWLLEKTRDKKKFSLLFKESISYGFRRNCFGIKWHGLFLAVSSVIFLAVDVFLPGIFKAKSNLIFSLTTMIFSCTLSSWWFFLVSPNWVKGSAESYAIRLLSSCEEINVT